MKNLAVLFVAVMAVALTSCDKNEENLMQESFELISDGVFRSAETEVFTGETQRAGWFVIFLTSRGNSVSFICNPDRGVEIGNYVGDLPIVTDEPVTTDNFATSISEDGKIATITRTDGESWQAWLYGPGN
ncbi:MAG: hypothetical protein LBL47_00520 [Lactobacillus sp.]|jgi:hypothetical protein|nr:hypothetical protein [Lactobacillus sp.]